jgi:hypothetical protein
MTNDLSNIFFYNFGTSEGRSAAGIFASSKAAILLSDLTPNAASDAARELNFLTTGIRARSLGVRILVQLDK